MFEPIRFQVFLLTFLLLSPANTTYAHAVVTESSLTKESVEPNHATTIMLMFNAGVELPLSRVFLVTSGDVYHPVHISKGNKPGQLLVEIPALEPGDYAIKYKVFAADGHLTENAIRFHVGQ